VIASFGGVHYGQQAAAPVASVAQSSQSLGAAVPAPPPAADASGDKARQQINNQMADLAALALALKTDVDKSTKDELSLAVVRKAGEIEVLAHRVREEMQPVVASKK
jgi:hypothetical protein